MRFSFGRSSAQQEKAAQSALSQVFGSMGNLEASLTAAKERGKTAYIVEIADQDQVGNIGKTSAFAAFRDMVIAARPDVVDVRPVTSQHFETFGFSQKAAAALYFKEPTLPRRAGVWFFNCAG